MKLPVKFHNIVNEINLYARYFPTHKIKKPSRKTELSLVARRRVELRTSGL